MMVYRGMDIGTAKPTIEQRGEIPHGMIDVADPADDYSVATFQSAARAFAAEYRRVIVVGGSGLHFRSVVDPLEFPPHDPGLRAEIDVLEPAAAVARLLELDPAAGAFVDLENPRRVSRALEIAVIAGEVPSIRHASPDAAAVRAYRPLFDFVGIGMDPGSKLAERITGRVDAMLASGLVDEVRSLAESVGRNAAQAVGYKEILLHLSGDATLEDARSEVIAATNALARRQRTYFGRDPRLRWLGPDVDFESAVSYCLDLWT